MRAVRPSQHQTGQRFSPRKSSIFCSVSVQRSSRSGMNCRPISNEASSNMRSLPKILFTRIQLKEQIARFLHKHKNDEQG